MRVLEGEPAAWFLLSDGSGLYLDVNVSISAVAFGLLIQLTGDERARLGERGRDFAGELATGIANSPRAYYPRNITSREVHEQVTAAVVAWRRETGSGPGA